MDVWKAAILSAAAISLLLTVQGHDFQTESEIVQAGNESFWKYYSPSKSLDNPSNSINIVFNDTEGLEEQLLESWSYADGTDRYAYINGEWREENYQLEQGDYFGTRYHIRVYEAEEFAIAQAHFDIWDWFGLKHQVTNEGAEEQVNSSIDRENTEIDLGQYTATFLHVLLLPIIAVAVKTQKNYRYTENLRRKLILLASPIIILLSARLLSITIERSFSLHPYIITAPFYIFIAIGLPLTVYTLSKNLNKFYTASLPAIGFIIGLILDYKVLGITLPELEFMTPRIGLAASLGIIGYYSSQNSNSLKNTDPKTILGFALWISMLIVTYLLA